MPHIQGKAKQGLETRINTCLLVIQLTRDSILMTLQDFIKHLHNSNMDTNRDHDMM
jgi:hypothetical protein